MDNFVLGIGISTWGIAVLFYILYLSFNKAHKHTIDILKSGYCKVCLGKIKEMDKAHREHLKQRNKK